MAISGGKSTYGKYYRLEADLTGANAITQPIGNDSDKCFTGYFDGNGHTIDLNITGNISNAGLFAKIGGDLGAQSGGGGFGDAPGTVKNLVLTGVINVSGDKVKNAGAVVCSIDNFGSFLKGIASSVTVTVSGANASIAGGIAGSISNDTIVEHCYSTGNVSITNTTGGSVSAGGIAGESIASESTIRYCWVLGEITGDNSTNSSTGGIIGTASNSNKVSYCAALSSTISGNTSHDIGLFSDYGTYRIGSARGTLSNNYANSDMTVNGSTVSGALNDKDGADVTLAATEADTWWKTTAGWSSKFGTTESAPWKWDSIEKRPVLWFE